MGEQLLESQGAREPLQHAWSDAANPLGLDGIEFVEYVTGKPQALGHVLEMMGFQPVARHRAREVLLYRQGGLNIVINAQPPDEGAVEALPATPVIAAVALRVHDARAAYQRALERGAWDVPTHPQVMELNIPAIHGVGGSRIYFVDRWQEFSIYDVDFVPIPSVPRNPPAVAGIHFFGLVQYIGFGRTEDWVAFYGELLGAQPLAPLQRFGVMPAGTLMRVPARDARNAFMLQLIEPELDLLGEVEDQERLHRMGLGVPDVLAAVDALRARGVEFVESAGVSTQERGALTRTYLESTVFELVHSQR